MYAVTAWALLFCAVLNGRVGVASSEASKILILHTIDGSFLAVSVHTGKELWRISEPPVISQSLSDLRLFTATNEYGLVPSLDGQLYLMERNAAGGNEANITLKALPLSVDALFKSHFMLTDDSVLTGGKENSLFAFDPESGQIRYNCTRDGCSNPPKTLRQPENNGKPTILVYRTDHIVRAVHVSTGSEKWNLSIRKSDLCLIHNTPSYSTALRQKGAPMCGFGRGNFESPTSVDSSEHIETYLIDKIEIGLAEDEEFITARSKQPLSLPLWSYKIPSRIVRSWIYDPRAQSLKPFEISARDSYVDPDTDDSSSEPTLTPEDSGSRRKWTDLIKRSSSRLFKSRGRDTTEKSCSPDRLVYLGIVDGQLYVQLGDNRDQPLPTQINFPKLSGLSESLTRPPVLSSDHGSRVTSNDALVGYYRASYGPQAEDDSMCYQPFLSDRATSEGHMHQTGLVPWFPHDSTGSTDDSDGHTADAERDVKSSHWVLDSANDLLMLLIHANQESDRQRLRDGQSSIPSFWDAYQPLVQLLFLVLAIQLLDRFLYGRPQRISTHVTIPVTITSTTLLQFPPRDSFPDNPPPQLSACGTQSTSDFQSTYESEFEFVRCLGRGGFGRVFEVENRFDGCRYAIKRIQIDRSKEDERKFLREVKVLASLDHPGIVRYHRAWSECPPPGWQESRDKVLFGDLEESTRELTSLSPSVSHTDGIHHSVASTELTNGTWTKSNLRDSSFSIPRAQRTNSGDSLIFDYDNCQLPVSEHSKTTSRKIAQSVDKSTSNPSCDLPHLSYLYIQMQLCSPFSLRDWLSDRPTQEQRPDRPELYSMFRQIVDAVAYLHEHGLMHRDLKPSNILFDLTNKLKLADFGLVTSVFEQVNESDRCGSQINGSNASNPYDCTALRKIHRHTNHVGTDLYMSPEQERGDQYDYKVDIFSLGLIFVELLIPFQTSMQRIVTLTQAKKQCLPNRFREESPNETSFVMHLLDGEPSKRPTASEILTDPLLA